MSCRNWPGLRDRHDGTPIILAPNGLELSGPAKTPSYHRAELAGSAPLACGLGRQRVVSRMGVRAEFLHFSSSPRCSPIQV